MLAIVMAMASCWSFADFEVTQCDVIQLPSQMSDMESVFTTTSIWNGLPVTESYHTIAFANKPDTDIVFPMNSFPGKTDRFAVNVTGRIFIPEKGKWTFSLCHDAGFICTIAGNGYSDSFMEKEWSPIRDVKTLDIPIAGIYTVKIIHWNGGGAAMLEFAVAKGSHSEFNSSLFHLVGDSSSGITCVDPSAIFVICDACGGTGMMTPQSFDEGKAQKLSKNLFKKDGYVFQGWATSLERATAGIVDYTDEQEITPPSDMTLYAVWASPSLTLTAESADWSRGSITLRCEDSDTSGRTHKYTLQYYDESTGIWKDVSSVQSASASASLTDTAFSSRLGGIPPVRYRVSDENGRVSEPCVTRNRYGLFVGVGHYSAAYQAKIKIRRGWALSELPEIEGNTRRYSNLARSNGEFNVTELIETDAKVKNVDDAFVDMAEKAVPGDVCLFYASTHGDFDGNVAVLRFYDDDYTDSRLRTGTDLIAAKSAAVVCVLAACCSEAMVRQSTANVAVIAAANYRGSTNALFDKILWDYGWKDGWAGTGASLTFGDLSDYVANRYNAIFEGITLNGPDGAETWNVQIDNAPLLARITAGTRGTHASQYPPSAPSNVNAGQAVQRDRIVVSWDGDSDTDNYFIFFGGTGGGAYDDFEETPAVNKAKFKIEFKADDYECVERSSENAPVPFMIRAFNGGGVSTSAYAQGWVDIRRKVTLDPQGGMLPGRLPGESYVLDYRKGDGLGILPPAAKAGFTFAYWYRDNKAAGMTEIATEGTVVTDDVTYYAWWTDMTDAYLNQHSTIATAANGDIATAAAMTAANGCRTVGECYALGINPEDPDDDFRITSFRMDGAKPIITVNHTVDGSGESLLPRMKMLGKAELSGEWEEVPEEGNSAHRFFTVTVEEP